MRGLALYLIKRPAKQVLYIDLDILYSAHDIARFFKDGVFRTTLYFDSIISIRI